MPKAVQFMFKYKSATATVHVFEDEPATVYQLTSTKRKKGHATGLMRQIIKWADKHGHVLNITAEAFGEDSFKKNKDLADFYRRFGFTDRKNPPIHLKRKPH